MTNQSRTHPPSSATSNDLEDDAEVRSRDGWLIRREGTEISVMAPDAMPGMTTLPAGKGTLPARLLYALADALLRGTMFRGRRSAGQIQHDGAHADPAGEDATASAPAHVQLQCLILNAIGAGGSATHAELASLPDALVLAQPLATTSGGDQPSLGEAIKALIGEEWPEGYIEALIHAQLKHRKAANVLHEHEGIRTSSGALLISLPKAEKLVRVFGQRNDVMVIRQFGPPVALCARSQDHPDEGAEFLGPHNPDDDVSATVVWQGPGADAGEALRLLRAYRQATKFGSPEEVARTIEIENEIDAFLAKHASGNSVHLG